MQIVGFALLHNELENGNLENWLRCMSICDHIYVYDQGSTDASADIYRAHDNLTVIWSPVNNFANELACKQRLLEELLRAHPDTDWILWMDGDTLLDGRLLAKGREYLHALCAACPVDVICLGHYNLWRSDVYYRVDNAYHALDDGHPTLWRNTGRLRFDPIPGLHHSPLPAGLRSNVRVGINLIHRGFATDDQIIRKYETYKALGQTGWELERLLDENELRVKRLPREFLPRWFTVTDYMSPTSKVRIAEVYAKRG